MAVLPKYNLEEDAKKVKDAKTEDLKTLMIGPNPGNPVEMRIFQNPKREGLQEQLEAHRRLLSEGEKDGDDIKVYTQKRFIALVYTCASLEKIELT